MRLFTDKNYPIIISCAKELSKWTEKEVVALGFRIVETTHNTVVVRGDMRDVMNLNLKLRTAHRVLVPLVRARCRNIRELYELAYSIDWENQIEEDGYFSVSSIVHNYTIRDTRLPIHQRRYSRQDKRQVFAPSRQRKQEYRRGGIRVLGTG